ncbi:MAG: hypothetical protein R8G34_11365 [Paracoccaceae bacterium]|nr:hypothetical protein [Paracoccaceae bacterium]
MPIVSIAKVYTALVVANHGQNLPPASFGDILKMEWPDQFNLNLLGFLLLSAFWTAWRIEVSAGGSRPD